MLSNKIRSNKWLITRNLNQVVWVPRHWHRRVVSCRKNSNKNFISITLSKCVLWKCDGWALGDRTVSPVYCVEMQCSIGALPPNSIAINYEWIWVLWANNTINTASTRRDQWTRYLGNWGSPSSYTNSFLAHTLQRSSLSQSPQIALTKHIYCPPPPPRSTTTTTTSSP